MLTGGELNPLQRFMPLLWAAAGGLIYLSFGYTEMAGSDLWWHLAAGREILEAGSIWLHDTWSYSAAGQPWNNHEWLADIVYYLWASVFGTYSLVYWKWLVVIATFLVLQRTLYRVCGDQFSSLVMAALAVAIAAPFIDVRPHLYSLLGVSILLWMTLGRQSHLWALAALFLVWANLHGGFVFGLMALAILVFPWRELNLPALYRAMRIVLVCTLVCLLNPDGINVFLLPLTYAFDSSSPYRQLGEWLSPFRPGGIVSPLFVYFMWAPVLAVCYLLPVVRKRTGVPWEGLALTALTLAMSLTSRRFIPLFGMSLAVMLAPLMALGCRKLQLDRFSPVLAVLALLFAIYRLLPYPLQAPPAFHYLTAEYSYPVDLMNFVEVNGIEGDVYAYYNWGGYLHWRTGGSLRVFIDGRANTIFDADTYNDYVAVLTSAPDWIRRIENSGAAFVLWPHFQNDGQQKLHDLLQTGRWRPVYRDSVGWLLSRSTVSLPEELVDAPDTPWRDLKTGQLSAWGGKMGPAIEYGVRVRETMPWNKGACDLLITALREEGRQDEADAVLRDCRGYFPSNYLE